MVFARFGNEKRARPDLVPPVLEHKVRVALYEVEQFIRGMIMLSEPVFAEIRLLGIRVLERKVPVTNVESHRIPRTCCNYCNTASPKNAMVFPRNCMHNTL